VKKCNGSVRPYLALTWSNRCFIMLSTEQLGDDVWCVDPHGVLTLSVSKETYERLGLIGQKLPFKNRVEQYGGSGVMRFSLSGMLVE